MSYHNGSIWPHDNSLIAEGFCRYGYKEKALKILTGLFDASIFMDLSRMPELFCGLQRRSGRGHTLYPVACLPQSWASGSVLMIPRACLGMDVEGGASRVRFVRPVLPPFLRFVRLRNLRVGDGSIDIEFQRYPHDVGVNVVRRERGGEVVVIK